MNRISFSVLYSDHPNWTAPAYAVRKPREPAIKAVIRAIGKANRWPFLSSNITKQGSNRYYVEFLNHNKITLCATILISCTK
jgi:hypothetical protein